MTYYGSGTLMNIKVKDVLPAGLQYADNANPVQNGVSGKNVYWNLTTTLTNGLSTSIEFNAFALSSGTNVNLVNITGSRDSGLPLYCQDIATVIVVNCTTPSLICDKKVRDPTTQQWVDQINANVGNSVRFRVTMTYYGSGTLMLIKVKDVLPVCLQYADNANIVQTAVSGKNVYWNLSQQLTNGQSISIEFDALVISTGTNVNVVNITGSENCVKPLYCQDTATVIVGGQSTSLICDKKVRDPTTQQWVKQINANVGNTVRFRVTMTYYGLGTFMLIKVKDILPTCLQYADNANIVQTAVSGKNVYWNLTQTLTNGQSLSIEFDTLVISTGTNVNVVNIDGSENCVTPLSCQDTATVIVNQPSLTCTKKVKNPTTKQWVDEINANVSDTVRFNITFTYSGTLNFYSIWVNDTLPACLQYADNAKPVETTIVGKIVLWHLSIVLSPGQSYSIEFDAKVISNGTNVNTVTITGVECGVRILTCSDTATVIVKEVINPLVADAHGPYAGYTNESIQLTGSATGGKTTYTWAWDLDNDGAYDDSSVQNPTHTWSIAGTYTIKIKVTDSLGTNATDSAQVTVSKPNTAPNKPSTPTGPTSGKTNKALTFSSGAVDPDSDQVYLYFDWGDGNNSGWIGPFNSGTAHNASHTWAVKGTYSIKVKAKDTHGDVSSWSDGFTIKIKKSLDIQYPSLFEKIMNRFPALENLLTALFNMIQNMRMNPS
jgi:fimbrial isopeptide formation D2 family protein